MKNASKLEVISGKSKQTCSSIRDRLQNIMNEDIDVGRLLSEFTRASV